VEFALSANRIASNLFAEDRELHLWRTAQVKSARPSRHAGRAKPGGPSSRRLGTPKLRVGGSAQQNQGNA
jgi:hypothetical protein